VHTAHGEPRIGHCAVPLGPDGQPGLALPMCQPGAGVLPRAAAGGALLWSLLLGWLGSWRGEGGGAAFCAGLVEGAADGTAGPRPEGGAHGRDG
ncbi:unnamed protein product, partial [Effrenium voratum]